MRVDSDPPLPVPDSHRGNFHGYVRVSLSKHHAASFSRPSDICFAPACPLNYVELPHFSKSASAELWIQLDSCCKLFREHIHRYELWLKIAGFQSVL
jgi:hypothetical protein